MTPDDTNDRLFPPNFAEGHKLIPMIMRIEIMLTRTVDTGFVWRTGDFLPAEGTTVRLSSQSKTARRGGLPAHREGAKMSQIAATRARRRPRVEMTEEQKQEIRCADGLRDRCCNSPPQQSISGKRDRRR